MDPVSSAIKFPEKQVIRTVALLTVLVNSMILVGWFFRYEKVLRVFPGALTMKFNTALGFLLIGIGLFIFDKEGSVFSVLRTILPILISTIGFLMIPECILFSIRNYGIGIPDEDLSSLFQPFSHGRRT